MTYTNNMLRIGMQTIGYAERRTIIDKLPDVVYVTDILSKKTSKIQSLLNKIKGSDITKGERHLIHLNQVEPKIDFFHLFNSVLFGKNNWGVTFETVVPFYRENEIHKFLQDKSICFDNELAVKKLYSKDCKFIIAISQNAYTIQLAYLSHFPQYKNRILKKMHCLHPPQKINLVEYHKPAIHKEIHFLFVGRDLFRKGGIEVIRASDKILQKHSNFKVTIVGSLLSLSTRFEIKNEDIEDLHTLIKKNKNIEYFESLDSITLLALMKNEIHVGLLPTHADTYGYSVLELQSAGCPVISTNIRALEEINNQSCGWMINIPKSELGESTAQSEEEYLSLQNTIEQELMIIITSILKNPEIIKSKAIEALNNIKLNHDPQAYTQRLTEIYNLE